MNKAAPVLTVPRTWSFSLGFLPPSINHMYKRSYTTGKPFLTESAEGYKEEIRWAAKCAGFRPDTRSRYGVIVVYHMRRWDDLDVDNGLKSLMDAALSSRTDHRVVHLLVDKRVHPDCTVGTDVEIWRLNTPGTVIDWMRELVAREDRVLQYASY